MKKVKRVAALIGVIFLVSLYLLTFISSFFTTKYTNGLFMACIFSTFAVPVMIYAYMLVYKILSKIGHRENKDDPTRKDSSNPADK